MLAHPASLQFFRLMFEDERPRRGELVYEIILTDIEADRLPADRWAGFKVINHFQPVLWPRQGGEGRVAVAHLDWLFDDQRLLFGGLFDDAGFLNRLDKG